MATNEEMQEAAKAYRAVGELILTASMLDHQVNRVCVAVLGLIESPMLFPTVASLDSSRKLEILKAYASNIRPPEWKRKLVSYCEDAEKINRERNVAAHSVMHFDEGKAVLGSYAAAKVFKAIKKFGKEMELVSLERLDKASRLGEEVTDRGEDLILNFNRISAELRRRKTVER